MENNSSNINYLKMRELFVNLRRDEQINSRTQEFDDKQMVDRIVKKITKFTEKLEK